MASRATTTPMFDSQSTAEDAMQIPVLNAISSSTRAIYQLLSCISFASKAHVQITKSGLRFSADESRILLGICKLEPNLFTSYVFTPPAGEDYDEDDGPIFQISLFSLLETLKIFGINELKERSGRDPAFGGVSTLARGGPNGAFDKRVLGMAGICRITWAGEGEPLCIVLEETGVTTTCELVTYTQQPEADIPLQKDHLAFKIITRATWLSDAVNELSATDPETLTILASPSAPFFSLSATGPHGSATVEFSKDPQLLETFSVPSKNVNTFKYSLIRHASRAMGMATKVSMREDIQGVLSMQFMIEIEEGKTSFVEFRLVAYAETADESDGEENGPEGSAGET